MADLAEALLRMAAPAAAGHLARQQAETKDAQKMAEIQALSGSRERIAGMNNTAKASMNDASIAGKRQEAMLRAAASMGNARLRAQTMERINPNSPDAQKVKMVIPLLNNMNILLNSNSPAVQEGIRFAIDYLGQDIGEENTRTLHDFHSSISPSATQMSSGDFMDELYKAPEIQRLMQVDPEMAKAIQQHITMKQQQANPGAMTPVPSAGQAPAPAPAPAAARPNPAVQQPGVNPLRKKAEELLKANGQAVTPANIDHAIQQGWVR